MMEYNVLVYPELLGTECPPYQPSNVLTEDRTLLKLLWKLACRAPQAVGWERIRLRSALGHRELTGNQPRGPWAGTHSGGRG